MGCVRMQDDALVFLNEGQQAEARTHVLVIGVGNYKYGEGTQAGRSASVLSQLSSPPHSARALVDWFAGAFWHPEKPLGSVSMLVSEEDSVPYSPPGPHGGVENHAHWVINQSQFIPPRASLANVKSAVEAWAQRLRSDKDMAVFCFCGHGVSVGQKATLLLDDFGEVGHEFEAGILIDTLLGTMRNCRAIQQLFLFDCCRTRADEVYKNEDNLGTRVLSVPHDNHHHDIPAQQFIFFPTLDGEEAFGIRDDVSVFTHSFIDAVSGAAADCSVGPWRTTTARIMDVVDKLVQMRVPPELTRRAKPSTLNGTSFEFNEVETPQMAKSFVTISDRQYWGQCILACEDPTTSLTHCAINTVTVPNDSCWPVEVSEGRWRFTGTVPVPPPPGIHSEERIVRAPVAYVNLKVHE